MRKLSLTVPNGAHKVLAEFKEKLEVTTMDDALSDILQYVGANGMMTKIVKGIKKAKEE